MVLAGRPRREAKLNSLSTSSPSSTPQLALAKTRTRPALHHRGWLLAPIGPVAQLEQVASRGLNELRKTVALSPTHFSLEARDLISFARERESWVFRILLLLLLRRPNASPSAARPRKPAFRSSFEFCRSHKSVCRAEHCVDFGSRPFSRVEPSVCRVARLMFLRLPRLC
ncbi:hypothetical protein NL676_001834 [Syzygium grande]|nr:hypothetical protein NL676_001834 [Syzygium grande]